MLTAFNWVDALVLIIIVIYVLDGYRQGLLRLILDLVGVIVSFLIALKYYNVAAVVLSGWGLASNMTRPMGFLVLWILSQMVFYLLAYLIYRYLPTAFHENKVNKIFGAVLGVVKGVIVVSIFLILTLVLPIPSATKDKLSNSLIASRLIKATAEIESKMDVVLGQLNNNASFLGRLSNNGDVTKLDFQTSDTKIADGDEVEMLLLVNEARAKAGLPELKSDTLLRNVARAHSRDMLLKGYFAHINPAGQSPTDRLIMANAKFTVVGENLALAPTVDIAHVGLMNSPKHRENILDPKFKTIGIGVIDAGIYGKMFTQVFTD